MRSEIYTKKINSEQSAQQLQFIEFKCVLYFARDAQR